MMTDTLTRHGWRPMPDDDVRKRWEAKGGRWMVASLHPHGGIFEPCEIAAGTTATSFWASMLWRPCDKIFEFAPWMWAVATGESLAPTEPGWQWWRLERGMAWRAVSVGFFDGDIEMRIAGRVEPAWYSQIGGEFGGPCTGMPPEGFGDE